MSENQEPKRMTMNDVAQKVTKGNKVAGIIVGICMIVLGILFIWRPGITAVVAMYFATIAFIIYGIYQIIVYARAPKEARNGWTLANGIIFTIIGVLLLFSGPFEMAWMFIFLLAFLAIFGGITQMSSYGAFKRAGEPGAGWIMASGVINLILGIFLLFMPFAGFLAVEILVAIYLIVGGIALFAESASGKAGMRPA